MVAEDLERHRDQASGGLTAGGEQVRRDAHGVGDLGQRPVGERRGREPGEHVVARIGPPVLDVGRELLVEVLEWCVLERLALRASEASLHSPVPAEDVLAEAVAVVLGHAEQVGDDQQREGLRVLGDELALALGEELVDRLIGELPHELLVLLEPLGRDEPHEERAVRGVLGRVERGELVAERELVAVLLDELGDVVALDRDREPGERSGDGGARRPDGLVVVDGDGLLVARDHPDVVVRLVRRRAVRADGLVVRRTGPGRRRGRGRSRRIRDRGRSHAAPVRRVHA